MISSTVLFTPDLAELIVAAHGLGMVDLMTSADYCVTLGVLEPGQTTDLHYHKVADITIVALTSGPEGVATDVLELDDGSSGRERTAVDDVTWLHTLRSTPLDELPPLRRNRHRVGQVVRVAPRILHRAHNYSDEPAVVIEHRIGVGVTSGFEDNNVCSWLNNHPVVEVEHPVAAWWAAWRESPPPPLPPLSGAHPR